VDRRLEPKITSQGSDEEVPERPAIIDCELVACSPSGAPNFYKLLASRADASELCLWVFDLLHLNGADLRDEPLAKRRAKLERLVQRHDCPAVLFSESFTDPQRLLAACEERSLEGIVSKRLDGTYRSGSATDWVKVKSAAWREANKDRWRPGYTSHAAHVPQCRTQSIHPSFISIRSIPADCPQKGHLRDSQYDTMYR
jgi:ATP-dependent DNA ligase